MKQKHLTFFLCLISFPLCVKGQWKLGVTGGADYNIYSINNHYMIDWHYKGAWGGSAGIMAQYDFNSWFGVRGDLNWAMKSHKQYRTGLLSNTNFRIENHYIQLPIMASFNFGGEKIKGILNIGGYGAYWLSSYFNGKMANGIDYPSIVSGYFSNYTSLEFVDKRDNRFDCGFVLGIGVDWNFSRHWGAQVEARCYYSTLSTQKDYMLIKDPKYNTTLALQFATYYSF